jgi:hypothetical protein
MLTAIRWAAVVLVLLTPAWAIATPETETWRRASLIGENSEHYFRWMLTVQPVSSDTFTESLRFQKINKRDLAQVEDVLVREVVWKQAPNRVDWIASREARPPFDVGARLSQDSVRLAFADDAAPALAVDDSGAWLLREGERERVLDRAELDRQIPELAETPRVAGARSTWHLVRPSGEPLLYYYSVLSGPDVDSRESEDLLLVPESAIRAAYARLSERLRAPKR